jgi:predicted metal-dependent hydrolase
LDLLEDPGLQDWLEGGIREWNAGRFWHAHEEWEQGWKATTGEEKAAFQGLILLAAALHKAFGMNHLRGGFANLRKADLRLARVPRVVAGIDLARLREEVHQRLVAGRLEPAPRIERRPAPRDA